MKHRVINKDKGFTLLELLVVIAIIGVLSTVVLASLDWARERARDAKRLSDMQEIRNALELYALDNGGEYPAISTAHSRDETSWNNLANELVPNYISDLPVDPVNETISSPEQYSYVYGRNVCSGESTVRVLLGVELFETTPPQSGDPCGGVNFAGGSSHWPRWRRPGEHGVLGEGFVIELNVN